MRILVIDDEPAVRSLVSAVLMDAGYEVAAAADGEQGLRAARALLPGLVVLDVGLPGMNGWDVLRRLRECPEHYRTPVIVLSGLLQDDERRLARSLGAEPVAKPFTPAALLQAVRGALLVAAA